MRFENTSEIHPLGNVQMNDGKSQCRMMTQKVFLQIGHYHVTTIPVILPLVG